VKLYLPNHPDVGRLEAVTAEMRQHGSPTIRVVKIGEEILACEGTHRAYAASILKIPVRLIVLDSTARLNNTGLQTYLAGLDGMILSGTADNLPTVDVDAFVELEGATQ